MNEMKMPEIPDFDQIADNLAADVGTPGDRGNILAIAEQLRQIWNARGACDLAAVDEVAHTNYEAVANAIRTLDR